MGGHVANAAQEEHKRETGAGKAGQPLSPHQTDQDGARRALNYNQPRPVEIAQFFEIWELTTIETMRSGYILG